MEDLRLKGTPTRSDECITAMINYGSTSNTSLPSSNKFTIPELKPNTKASTISHKLLGGSPAVVSGSDSNINQFLRKQKEQKTNNGHCITDRFYVPKLEKFSNTGFVIPEFKNGKTTKGTYEKINAIEPQKDSKIKAETEDQPELGASQTEAQMIDLTTALSATRINGYCNNTITSNDSQSQKLQTDSFKIPFIECDRIIPQIDNYCLIDISNVRFHHNLASPSTLGRILSSRTKKKIQLCEPSTQKAMFKAKHRIERFSFDTKSPDDIVLYNLNRFTRSQ